VLQNKPARAVAAAVAGSALAVSAWPAATHWLAPAVRPASAGVNQADALGTPAAGAGPLPEAVVGALARSQPKTVSVGLTAAKPGRHRKPAPSAPPGYLNPLRSVHGLVPERIDEGVDFTGSGPVYALGDAVVTAANAADYGWPGGGWITYRLTNGPAAGLTVYLAEDVKPAVRPGQHVTPGTVIGTMYNGYDGIEIGWAQPTGDTPESQLPAAGGIGGYGPFPTKVGLNFDELLQALGVPAAPNSSQAASGILPPGYPAF
jgi:murein DD-endopeptidase MepM/ murein hydrolase activator NlpD